MKIGKKIRNWTVLEYIGNNKNSAKLWKCKCKCGNVRPLTTAFLNYFHSTTCLKCHSNTEDCKISKKVINKKFGSWTAIKFNGRNKHNTRQWLCQCKCGSQRLFTTCYIIGAYKNRTKNSMCGKCRYTTTEMDARTNKVPPALWNKLLHIAKRRNIEVKITKNQATKKFIQQGCKCSLTGIPLYFTKLSAYYWKYTNASLDRIDSNKGYTLDNVQWVEKRINMMKQVYSQADFINLCKLVAKNN
jgi:hypothetical protein